jgi:hypothetical protein
MAQDDYSWWGGDGDFGELDASDLTQDILFHENSDDFDAYAQQLFVEAFFDQSEQAYEDLIDYMWDEYGIDFEDAFDWADFREWYG